MDMLTINEIYTEILNLARIIPVDNLESSEYHFRSKILKACNDYIIGGVNHDCETHVWTKIIGSADDWKCKHCDMTRVSKEFIISS